MDWNELYAQCSACRGCALYKTRTNLVFGTGNREAELTVNLQVPIGMGNDYAERVGEIDWVFTAEQHDDPEPPVIEPDEPAEEPDEPTEEPKEPGKTPFTGDTSSLMLYAVVLAAAGVALIVLIAKRKRQQ